MRRKHWSAIRLQKSLKTTGPAHAKAWQVWLAASRRPVECHVDCVMCHTVFWILRSSTVDPRYWKFLFKHSVLYEVAQRHISSPKKLEVSATTAAKAASQGHRWSLSIMPDSCRMSSTTALVPPPASAAAATSCFAASNALATLLATSAAVC